MSNHFHLIVESRAGRLSEFLKGLSGRYTRAFNDRHGRDGSLFRGRALTIGLPTTSSIVQASLYVHLNPVTARLCRGPSDWPWSSAAAYVGSDVPPDWLVINTVREMVGPTGDAAAYAVALKDGIETATAEFYAKQGA